MLLLLTYLMVHIHEDATKNLFSHFCASISVFKYLFALLFPMADVSLLCVTGEKFHS